MMLKNLVAYESLGKMGAATALAFIHGRLLLPFQSIQQETPH